MLQLIGDRSLAYFDFYLTALEVSAAKFFVKINGTVF